MEMQSEHHIRTNCNTFILLAVKSAARLKQYNYTQLAITFSFLFVVLNNQDYLEADTITDNC